jgi:hypothetical protein
MLDVFRRAYADPDAEVERALAASRRPIRTLGVDAPRTLLIEAGYQPIRLVAPPLGVTPRADAIMGATAMRLRGKRLLETLLDPARPEVPVLITAADDDQPQIFAALRELARLGEAVPRHVHFLDRLHLERGSSRDYTARRLEQLKEWLGNISVGSKSDLTRALLARQGDLMSRLASLRAQSRVSGTDALQVIGAAAILPVDEHVAALEALLSEFADAPAISGQRVFVCGSPHENAGLYSAIEAAGAVIVGEDHAWGASFASPDHPAPRVSPPMVRWSTRSAFSAATWAAMRPLFPASACSSAAPRTKTPAFTARSKPPER